jgi:hypothetical protein
MQAMSLHKSIIIDTPLIYPFGNFAFLDDCYHKDEQGHAYEDLASHLSERFQEGYGKDGHTLKDATECAGKEHQGTGRVYATDDPAQKQDHHCHCGQLCCLIDLY